MKYIPNSKEYFADQNGNIFRKFKSKIRKLRKNTVHTGYESVAIRFLNGKVKTLYVHRIIAELFIPNIEQKPVVNHINLLKSDNRVQNLEWVTYRENNIHMQKLGANRLPCGAANWAIYTTDQIEKVCQLLQEGYRNVDICSITGVSRNDVYMIRSGDNWTHISEKYDFRVKSRVRKLSVETVTWICRKIQDGKTDSEIVKESTNDNLTKSDVRHIRNKDTYKDIVSKILID